MRGQGEGGADRHGRGGARALRETFLGSTAERVIRQARVPVLVVAAASASGLRPAGARARSGSGRARSRPSDAPLVSPAATSGGGHPRVGVPYRVPDLQQPVRRGDRRDAGRIPSKVERGTGGAARHGAVQSECPPAGGAALVDPCEARLAEGWSSGTSFGNRGRPAHARHPRLLRRSICVRGNRRRRPAAQGEMRCAASFHRPRPRK